MAQFSILFSKVYFYSVINSCMNQIHWKLSIVAQKLEFVSEWVEKGDNGENNSEYYFLLFPLSRQKRYSHVTFKRVAFEVNPFPNKPWFLRV